MSKKSLIDEIVNIVSQLDNKNFSIKITESGGKTRTVYLNDPRLSSNLAFKTIDNLKLILEYAKTLVGKEEKKEETSVPSQVVNEKQEVKIPTVAKQNEVKVQENKIPSQHLYKTKNQLINEKI